MSNKKKSETKSTVIAYETYWVLIFTAHGKPSDEKKSMNLEDAKAFVDSVLKKFNITVAGVLENG